MDKVFIIVRRRDYVVVSRVNGVMHSFTSHRYVSARKLRAGVAKFTEFAGFTGDPVEVIR